MKNVIKVLTILGLILFSISIAYCQDNYASNVRTNISDDQKLFIHYDIVVNDGSKFFKVELEFTYEGERIIPNPNNLYGEHGSPMTPGNKIIYWNYSDDFEGDINQIEVKVFAFREAEPKALFTKDSLGNKGYAPCEIIFVNLSTNADKYEWNFGDPASGVENISYDENPIHTFKSGGSYTVTLSAINSKLELRHQFLETIIIKEYSETVADFQIIGYNREVPLTIEFKNNSRNADSFVWNFDDPGSGNKNNISTEENPKHKYVKDGKYVVELTAKNSISNFSDNYSKEVILIRPGNKGYKNHKSIKTYWMVGGVASLGVSAYTLSQSIKFYDEYKTATTDAEEIRKKYRTYGAISGITFGLSAVCVVQFCIHSKKQKAGSNQVLLKLNPIQDGALISLAYKFK